MANDATLKPSLFIQTLAPVLEEESFLNFLRAYYEWLQSTNLTFTGKVGNFTNGEIVIGDDSKAKGIIKVIGSNYVVLKMLSDTPFDLKETFEGQTSGAIATVVEIKDNVIRAASRLEKNRNSDKSVDKYFEYLKSEFNRGFPTLSEVDRRLISNKLKDFYQSKSNEDAYRFLFRAVYGSEIEFRYPGEEVLRVSDGDFEKTTIIRSGAPETIFNYLNQTIVGQTSGALGNVVDVKVTFLGGIRHAELTLKLVSGTFSAGETIYLLDDETEQTTIYGMIAGTTIVDAGSGYSVGDVLTISGDGSEASAEVSSVSSGPINKIKVNTVGHGYRLGTIATVNNTGTGGSGFSVKVSELANTYTITSGVNTYTVGEISKLSIVNRGSDYFKAPTITLDDNTIKTIGALSEKLITIVSGGNNYSVGDALVFTGGAGANAAGIVASVGNTDPYGANTILFEDGTNVLLDNSVNGLNSAIKNEDWTNLGPILRIELTNFGTGYTPTNLPTISVTSAGAGANLIATDIQGNSANVEVDVANNSIGLGAIRSIEITNFGIDYSSATIDTANTGDGNANVQPIISGIATTDGTFLTDDGKISVKILQDSLFFQDFSYVIRSGLVFNAYKELVKGTIHPAGLQFFGEILISSYILVAANFESVVATEQAQIDFIIKQILSFFPGSVNPITHVMEKNIELAPLDVWTGGILNEDGDHLLFEDRNRGYRLTKEGPQLNRKLEVEIAPEIQVVSYEVREIHIDIPLYIDATMAFYSEVIVSESIRTIEIDIETEIQVVSTEHREINVEITPKFEVITTEYREIVVGIPLYIDATMAFYSEVVTSESIRTIEVDIISETQVVSSEHREINVKISPTVIDQTFVLATEYVLNFELFLDATMAFYSEVVTSESIRTIEVDIETGIQVTTSEHREINVEISPTVIDQTFVLATEYILNFELFLDATMGLYSDVIVMESIATVEIKIESEIQVVSAEHREINIEISPQKIIFEPLSEEEVTINIVKSSDISSEDPIQSHKIEISPTISPYDYDIVGVNNITFGDLQILTLANTQILTYPTKTFDDLYGSSKVVVTNQKISGTVTISGNVVSGNATSFTSDFLENDFIIVNDEKFIVKTVANSTYMTINVNPAGTYTDVSAYKEVFV